VIDFGVARAAGRMGLTTARGTVGTPAYMAPEQARDTHEASVASDVYSLGATLLFAATGHPPYRGATVMDVLARLATDEPDLSGLPDELAGLITSCLHRVPRQRPTSSSMLVQLGDFTEAQAGPDEGHAYLPDNVMALIGEYQRNPQLTALSQPDEDRDATSASYTELPASYKPAPRRKPGHGRSGHAGPGHARPGATAADGAGGPGGVGGSGSGWRQWLRSHLAWAGWASAGAALVVVGVILGASLSGSGSPNPGKTAPGVPLAPPVPPHTVCGTSAASGPALCMAGQSLGTATAPWVVQGHGFAPGTAVTVSLTWNSPPQVSPNGTSVSTAAAKPVVARDGTLHLDLGQLFGGQLKLGLYEVHVAGADGSKADTSFIVIPPGG